MPIKLPIVPKQSSGRYIKDFPRALGYLQALNGKVKVRETGEPLKFSSEPYPLSLRIEPAGKVNYRVYPVIIDELSAVYSGYPTWLFFRNVVHPVYLPLTNENIDRLFNQELFISAKDLIYWSTVVHKQLHKQGYIWIWTLY